MLILVPAFAKDLEYLKRNHMDLSVAVNQPQNTWFPISFENCSSQERFYLIEYYYRQTAYFVKPLQAVQNSVAWIWAQQFPGDLSMGEIDLKLLLL